MAKKKSNIITIVAALAIFATCSGCGEKAEEQPVTKAATTATTTTVATTEATTTTTKVQDNPFEKTNKIYDDAKIVAYAADDAILQKAVDALRELKGHLFDSEENMYNAIYYGAILNCAYENTNTPYEFAGYHVLRAVVDVYAGINEPDDETTKFCNDLFETWIDQCPDIRSTATTTIITTTTTTAETTQAVSLGMQNALKSAKSYIEHLDFSYLDLIEQLEYEKYTHEEAVYGADHCGADWMQEAADCAASYLEHSSFSRQELYEQLLYEQFTPEQAEYALRAVGY